MKRMSEEKEQEQKLPEEREKIPAPENPSKEKAKKDSCNVYFNGYDYCNDCGCALSDCFL